MFFEDMNRRILGVPNVILRACSARRIFTKDPSLALRMTTRKFSSNLISFCYYSLKSAPKSTKRYTSFDSILQKSIPNSTKRVACVNPSRICIKHIPKIPKRLASNPEGAQRTDAVTGLLRFARNDDARQQQLSLQGAGRTQGHLRSNPEKEKKL